MAYIGQGPGSSGITDRTLDTITSDGSTTSLVLTGTADAAEDVAVYFDGVMQRPGTDFTLANNTLTFTSPVPNGVFVCAYTGGAEHIGSPLAGSVTSDMIVDNAVIDAKVATGVDASKITGALDAFDGSALTGISSNITKISSDPTITDNPSSAGGLHLNTTSGEMFVCTDNTTDENVWVNVGSGSGDVYKYQGRQYGYVSSGDQYSSIQRFSFASGTQNATDTNKDLSTVVAYSPGVSSALHGYIAGGGDSLGDAVTVIQRFDFASDDNATNVGNLVTAAQNNVAVNSNYYGYSMGGRDTSGATNILEKYSFDSQNNATDIGDLLTTYENGAGHATKTHGYASAGNDSNLSTNIFKITFSSNVVANYNGDLTTGKERRYASGVSSTDNGYTAGGRGPSNNEIDIIDKFSFSSEANSSNIGTFSARSINMPSSSTTHGYFSGGGNFVTGKTLIIERVDFSNDGSAVSVGNLTGSAFQAGSGHQV